VAMQAIDGGKGSVECNIRGGKPNGADTAKWRCCGAPIPKLGKIQVQMPSQAQRTQHYWQVETSNSSRTGSSRGAWRGERFQAD